VVVFVAPSFAATTAARSDDGNLLSAFNLQDLLINNVPIQVPEIVEELRHGGKIIRRETLVGPEPHSPHGANFAFSHGGFSNRPKPSHGFQGSRGYHGYGGGHSTR